MSTAFDPLDHPRDAIGRFDNKTGTGSADELGADTAVVDQAITDDVQWLLDALTGNADIDGARFDAGGAPNPDYPQAEHAAAVQALRTYVSALRGQKRGRGWESMPLLIEPTIYPNPDPLPDWPTSLPEPSVSFELDDDLVRTAVDLGDGRVLYLWTEADETHDNSESHDPSDAGYPYRGLDDDTAEQVAEWAWEVHHRIDGNAYGAQAAAVNHTGFQAATLDAVLGPNRRGA